MSDDQKSIVVIEFDGPGSVMFRSMVQNVTPLQLLALAGYLEVQAKDAVVREMHSRSEEAEQKRLSVPSPKIMVPGK